MVNFEKEGIDEIDYLEFVRKISESSHYRTAAATPCSKVFIDNIAFRKAHNLNMVIQAVGSPGSGKSRGIIFIAQTWDAAWSLDKLYFEKYALLEALYGAVPYSFYVRDEEPKEFGLGSGRIEETSANIEKVIRQQQICLGYCSPELEIHSSHFVIEPIFVWRRIEKTLFWLFKGAKNYPSNPTGIIRLGNPKIDFKEYERRKDEFINRLKKQEFGGNFQLSEIADQFLDSKYVGSIESSKEIKTRILDDPEYPKNLTIGEMQELINKIIVRAKDRGIQLFRPRERQMPRKAFRGF